MATIVVFVYQILGYVMGKMIVPEAQMKRRKDAKIQLALHTCSGVPVENAFSIIGLDFLYLHNSF